MLKLMVKVIFTILYSIFVYLDIIMFIKQEQWNYQSMLTTACMVIKLNLYNK